MNILSNSTTPENIRNNVLSNYKFYCPALEEFRDSRQTDFLITAAGSLDAGVDFVSSTPSIVFDPFQNAIIICVRYVNYRLSTTCSGYKLKDTITSKNRMIRFSFSENGMQKTDDFWLKYDTSLDDYYCGIEDIRLLIDSKGNIKFNGNRVLKTGEIRIEHGELDWANQSTNSKCINKKTESRKIEKNWVLFGDQKVIYEWFPLSIGEYCIQPDGELLLEITAVKKTPAIMKYVRGSSNGIIIGDEIWFLCHIVSYQDKPYYYHLFVTLNVETEEIRRVSKYFSFGKEKRVEYSLGFLYLAEGEFLIGYSQMDCETRFLTISRTRIEELFIFQ
jgi:hypothetical protein